MSWLRGIMHYPPKSSSPSLVPKTRIFFRFPSASTSFSLPNHFYYILYLQQITRGVIFAFLSHYLWHIVYCLYAATPMLYPYSTIIPSKRMPSGGRLSKEETSNTQQTTTSSSSSSNKMHSASLYGQSLLHLHPIIQMARSTVRGEPFCVCSSLSVAHIVPHKIMLK